MAGWALPAWLAACGGAQRPTTTALRPLPEARALEVVLEGFAQAGAQAEIRRRIRIQGEREMEIDVAVRGRDHGVEYVQAQDRVDFGDALPRRQQADSLLTMTGAGPDAAVDVLILDDREFLYEPDPEQAGPGHPTVIEVEDRLRRAVIDYLTYLRRQGQL